MEGYFKKPRDKNARVLRTYCRLVLLGSVSMSIKNICVGTDFSERTI